MTVVPLRHLRRIKPRKRARLTALISVKTTPERKAELEEIAGRAGMRLSDYVRAVVERRQVTQVLAGGARDGAAIRKLTAELIREGRNLNDLARWANTNRLSPEAKVIAAELEGLFRVWQKVMTL